MTDYASLLPFCESDHQRAHIQSLVDHGSIRKAARAIGKHPRRIEEAVARVRRNASRRGYSPDHGMTHAVPDTHIASRVSTLRDAEGQIRAQWTIASLSDQARLEALREAVEALKGDITPVKAVKPPKAADADLLNLYVITDYHVGMRAWPEETRGEAWDTDIAEETLARWFAHAIASSPNAERAVLCQLGDLLHFDSLQAVTPTSGNLLDADTRYQRVVRVVIRVLRRIVAMLLAKHQSVHIIMAEGNHDIASSAWLREVFDAFYAEEPRVTVDVSPDPYYAVEHQETGLFFHHGHLSKQDRLDRVFVAKFREIYGRVKHAYGHTGHYHSRNETESELMPIKRHRTIAPNDSHSSRHGYNAGRDAQVITYHREHGEVQSMTISPAMLA